MLTSEMAALLASGARVSDDGITVLKTKESDNQQARRSAVAHAMKRLRHSLRLLHRLGIQSIENSDPDPDRPDKDYLFIAKDDATLALYGSHLSLARDPASGAD